MSLSARIQCTEWTSGAFSGVNGRQLHAPSSIREPRFLPLSRKKRHACKRELHSRKAQRIPTSQGLQRMSIFDSPRALPSIRAFCIEHGIWNKVEIDGKRVHTHLDLFGGEGGIMNIPNSLNEEFLEIYANAIQQRTYYGPCFLVEKKTEVFRMFFDVDLKVNESRRPSTNDFFLIFRQIVNREQALLIHASSIAALDLYAPHIGTKEEGWRTILDSCVYEENGLRMIGSDKITKCPECKDKKAKVKTCKSCSSKGKVMCGRPYQMAFAMTGDGMPDHHYMAELANDYLKTVRATSIRSFEKFPHPQFTRYEGCPSIIALRKVETKTNTTYHVVNTHSVDDEGMASMKKSVGGRLIKITDDDILRTITALLQRRDDRWRNIVVRRASYTSTERKEIWVTVGGEGSSFCLNVKRDHTSNTIYFSITPEGVVQRCFSKKECSKFCSERFRIVDFESDILFPPKGNKRKRDQNRPCLKSDTRENERCTMGLKISQYQSLKHKLHNKLRVASRGSA